MNEIIEVQQLMDPPPGLRPDTVHAARHRLMQAAIVPARKQRRWVVPVVAGAGAAAAAVVAVAAGAGPHPQFATLTAWTVHRTAADTVTVTVRQLRDPAGLQRSLSAAGVPALVQFNASPCPFPYQAIQANAAKIGRVLEREVRGPSGLVFTIHPSAIPLGAMLDLVFPLNYGDDKPLTAPAGLPSTLPSAAPLRGIAAPHPVAIRLIPSDHPQCLQPAPNPSAS